MLNYAREAVVLCTGELASPATQHMVTLCLGQLSGVWIKSRILFTKAGLKHCSS